MQNVQIVQIPRSISGVSGQRKYFVRFPVKFKILAWTFPGDWRRFGFWFCLVLFMLLLTRYSHDEQAINMKFKKPLSTILLFLVMTLCSGKSKA